MARSRVEGLERLRSKVLQRLPKAAKEKTKAGNRRNAEEFDRVVRQALKRGDPKDGNLVDTLAMTDAGETGVQNSLGSAEQPHAFHLEGGHRNKDGSHTPPRPTWNPAKVVVRKKAKARSARVLREVVKMVSEGR